MPYLSITTNVALTAECESALAAEASKIVADELGKPQTYVMVSVQPVRVLRFAGSEEPAAFLEVKSIGFPNNLTAASLSLTKLMERHTGVPASRVYITFDNVSPSRWAHEGDTFT